MLRVHLGTQLGFDEHFTGSMLHSLYLEVRYTYIGSRIAMFDGVDKQFSTPPAAFGDDYLINPGGVSLALGINFEFRPPLRSSNQ